MARAAPPRAARGADCPPGRNDVGAQEAAAAAGAQVEARSHQLSDWARPSAIRSMVAGRGSTASKPAGIGLTA